MRNHSLRFFVSIRHSRDCEDQACGAIPKVILFTPYQVDFS